MNIMVDFSENKSAAGRNVVVGMEYMKRIIPGIGDGLDDGIADADTAVDAVDRTNGFVGTLVKVEG